MVVLTNPTTLATRASDIAAVLRGSYFGGCPPWA
jgi:hypothetical protein